MCGIAAEPAGPDTPSHAPSSEKSPENGAYSGLADYSGRKKWSQSREMAHNALRNADENGIRIVSRQTQSNDPAPRVAVGPKVHLIEAQKPLLI
jgi:hypothetical protein